MAASVERDIPTSLIIIAYVLVDMGTRCHGDDNVHSLIVHPENGVLVANGAATLIHGLTKCRWRHLKRNAAAVTTCYERSIRWMGCHVVLLADFRHDGPRFVNYEVPMSF